MEIVHGFSFDGLRLWVNSDNPSQVDNTPNIQFVERLIIKNRLPLNFLTLNITQVCNLSCTYCFGSHLNNITMNEDTAFASVNYLLSQNDGDVGIRFFGGEPLLNFELLKSVTEYVEHKMNLEGNSRKVFFNIFTNALNLRDEHIEFFKRKAFSVFISLDGPADIHDQNRIRKDGSGSFVDVFKNARRLVNELPPYRVTIRAVVDPSVGSSLIEIVEALFDTGAARVSFTLPWVLKNSSLAVNIEHADKLKKSIEDLGIWYLNNIKNRRFDKIGLHPFVTIMGYYLFPSSNLYAHSCGAGVEAITVSSEGTMFPCHAFAGYPQFAMGDVSTENHSSTDVYDEFLRYQADNIKKCGDCWAKYICLTRCPADTFIYSGDLYDINQLRCDVYRRLFEVSLGICYILKHNYPKEYKVLKRLLGENINQADPH